MGTKKGAKTRELIIYKSELGWFREIMFYMDINLREVRPGVREQFVVIRYVCGEKKQKKMIIASARKIQVMRA